MLLRMPLKPPHEGSVPRTPACSGRRPDWHEWPRGCLRTLLQVSRLPPRKVGPATLIDTREELARIGRVARNCLGRCVHNPYYNSATMYVWEDDDEPIFIQADRTNGLGWFLSDMKLAKNRPLPDERRQLVGRIFETAGFDLEAVARNLTTLLAPA